jgi:hypothetical protein
MNFYIVASKIKEDKYPNIKLLGLSNSSATAVFISMADTLSSTAHVNTMTTAVLGQFPILRL